MAGILNTSEWTITRWCKTNKLSAKARPYGKKTTYEIPFREVERLLIEQELGQHNEDDKKSQVLSCVSAWHQAIAAGLLTGRPFSQRTVEVYRFYVDRFLARYQAISVQTLKDALLCIDPVHFAKREKLFKAVVSFAKYLIQENRLESEFLEQIKVFRPKRHLPPKRISVDEKQLDSLLGVCKTPLDRLLIVLLSSTGIRCSEACALRWEDIDLEKQVLIVRLGKGNKTRRVGLNSQVIEAINRYRARQKFSIKPTDFLLLNVRKHPMDRNGLYQRVVRLGQDAGIKVSPHALRRAFVTINVNRGKPLVHLQIAAGHSDIKTTRSYCMTTEQEVIDAMKGWD